MRRLKLAHVSRIYRVRTESGCELGCSFDHPLITGPVDHYGTPAQSLKRRLEAGVEVTILTRPNGKVVDDRVVKMDEEFGDFLVGTPLMTGAHIYIANRVLGHNKIAIEEVFI